MEAVRVGESLELPNIHEDDVMNVPDHGLTAATQSGISTMILEDIDPKEGPSHWQESPERTTSLLPPFGAGQSSHLPTPQSPGDLINYLVNPAESPLSSDHVRTGSSRQFSSLRPPSRPASAHPPKTPQSVSSTSASKNRFYPLPSTPELDHGRSYGSPTRPSHSQIVTPSPEIYRTRRASVPHTPSDSETMLAMPRVGKRSLSHPYTGPSVLAPAPIISPANSSHSTVYQVSPEVGHPVIQTGRTYRFSHSMAALVSEHNIRSTEHNDKEQEAYNLDDPFIARDDEDHMGIPPVQYPSPPISRHHDRSTMHDDRSTISRPNAVSPGGLEARAVTSRRDSSEGPLCDSLVKTEVEEGDYGVTADALQSSLSMTPYRAPASPRTPPPGMSGAGSSFELRTSLEGAAFHVSPHVAGGEIERIRQRQAGLAEVRMLESEKRRPEYLVRTKRARHDIDEEVAERERERESALSGLGVFVSPTKGRRLKLYRPVPIVDNPTPEGNQTPENDMAGEPKTPPTLSTPPSTLWQPTVPIMSLRAIDWRTPVRRRSSSVTWTEEDEIKKQKRLAAFAAPQVSGRWRRLKPVEVPGRGRMIVDVTLGDARELAEAGLLKISGVDTLDDAEPTLISGHGADWPDDEYPWSLQERERDNLEEAERRRRLRRIERFLDRESESDEEDNELPAGPSTWNQTHDGGIHSRLQQGRGEAVSSNAVPGSKSDHHMPFDVANFNAREVLMSKRHVREAAERARKRKMAEEEEGVVMCICQGADDGRPMVRCDECRTWYHLVCMDIEDESELGDEWFCWKCVPTAEDSAPAPPSEPTFAPAMPDSPPRTGVGDLPLYQSALQPSPMLDIRARAPVTPSVRSRRKRDPEHSPARRSRLPHPVGDPGDPVRGGPSTPYHPRSADSRLYSTPKFYDEYGVDDYTPFDPTSTPSRGLKFPNAVPITPRRPHPWTPAQAVQWTTPSGPPQTPQFSSQTGSSSIPSLTYSLSTLDDSVGPLTSPWPSDESPVRRPHKPSESTWPYPPPRRLLDSPLAMRGAINRPFPSGVEDSPTGRAFHRGKDREIADLISRTSHGQSPRRE